MRHARVSFAALAGAALWLTTALPAEIGSAQAEGFGEGGGFGGRGEQRLGRVRGLDDSTRGLRAIERQRQNSALSYVLRNRPQPTIAVPIYSTVVPGALSTQTATEAMQRNADYRSAVIDRQNAETLLASTTSAATVAIAALAVAEQELESLVHDYAGRDLAEIDSDIVRLGKNGGTDPGRKDQLLAERELASRFEARRVFLRAMAESASRRGVAAMTAVAAAETERAAAIQAEQSALNAVANGRSLSPTEIAFLQARLGL